MYQDVILDNNKTLHYKYDYLGRPTEHIINTANNIHTYYTYHDAPSYGANYTTNLVKTEGNAQGTYSYTYDSSNNLKTVSRKLPGETAYTLLEEYSYYDLGQLKVVNYLQSNERHFYTYDEGGNIQTEKIYDITDYDNPVLENTITYTYGDNTWGDLLTNYNGSTIEYDNIGNPTTYRNGISLTWQNGRQLQKYQKGSDVITYTYGAGGMRLSKTVNGTTYTYLYNGDQLVQETIGDKILDFSYDASGTVYAVRVKENANDEGTYYYYAHNTRGDVTALYTAGGNLYVKYNYDVWGNTVSVINSQGVQVSETSSNISIIQPFRYRGYCFDKETGLYYLQSRYYDPEICRFINADLPEYAKVQRDETAGINVFVYCCNDAVNNSDGLGCAVNKNDTNVKISDFIKKHNLVQTSFNCFSYAVGIYNKHTNIPKFNEKSTINDCKIHTIDWLKKHKYRVNDVTNSGGCNYQTKGHTWLIALRIGSFTIGANTYYDFHFMKRSNVDKTWSFKGGKVGNVYNLKSGKNPNNSNWNIYYLNKTKIQYEKVYRSKIIYLAITN